MSSTMSGQGPEPESGRRRSYRSKRREELSKHREPQRDGRLISTHPACPHGTSEGRDLYVCECRPCTHAVTARQVRRRERFRLARIESLAGEHGVDLEGLRARDAGAAGGVAARVLAAWRGSRGAGRVADVAEAARGWPGLEDGAARERYARAVVEAISRRPGG